MYIIIGGDGNEYGPVSGQQLREWIAAGRANLQTRARREGEAEWKQLGDFSEFGPGATGAVESRAGGTDGPPPLQAGTIATLPDPGTRFAAYMIDSVCNAIAMMPGLLFMMMSIIASVARNGGEPPSAEEMMNPRFLAGCVVLAVGLIALSVIQVVMLTRFGQTIGKRMMKIRIVRLNGDNPGFFHAVILRGLIPFMIQVIPVLMIGPIFFLVDSCFIFRSDRRCIHDLIARTRVVRC